MNPFSVLRHVHAGLGHLPSFVTGFGASLARNTHSGSSRLIPTPPQFVALESPEETALARAWVAKFRAVPIPKAAVEFSFSRSSGPGGQNVNKVNTKATLRCRIDEDWVPLWASAQLKRSPHYVSSSQSIQITSTVHRSQSQNVDECLSKFHAVLVEAASSELKNEPSEAQRRRVEGLMKAASARRRSEKAHRSKVKAGRKGARD
ncbi:RF-1 domain-containing protein [Mycena vulgaris]|nr:RF-1 domain-containing protein [Mycena vulgaris]